MGLGLLGRGIGDVRFLAEQGARLIVTDLKSREELSSSLRELATINGHIEYILGEHRLEDFRNRDFILKAAGVPLDSPYIAEARRNHIPIEMSTALFAAYTPATIVGVTGTRGKSTVTHLLHAIFTAHTTGKVFLGGNVRGISTLPFLTKAAVGDVAVLELDSWQLQGFAERQISPHIGVFTTFLPDHLNYYKNNLCSYFSDKAAIFLYQKVRDVCVVGEQVTMNPYFQEYMKTTSSSGAKKIIIANQATLPDSWRIRVPGIHNRYNAGVAMAAARAAGVPDTISRSVIESFTGVPGRLELVATVRGVSFYNDTTATTPDATIAALQALGKSTILIMGGADKQLDMSALLTFLPRFTKTIVLLPGSGTTRISSQLHTLGLPIREAATMAEAVAAAVDSSEPGDTILLSPAFASFGLFTHEFDRGDQFNQLVLGFAHNETY